jgi:hypothetical protein
MAADRGPEFNKHAEEDEVFYGYLKALDQLHDGAKDVIGNFPAYVGYVNLARFLMLYDLYKGVMDVNGHIADVGTYRGASLLFFAKMIKLFEPHSTTVAHGFDWFEGMKNADVARFREGYLSDLDRLIKLTAVQGLAPITKIHKLDLTKDLPEFFAKNDYLRFKIVFLDCGVTEVIRESLTHFWPRISNGGILVLDHYNTSTSPSESILLDELIEGRIVKTMPFSRQPTAYVVK